MSQVELSIVIPLYNSEATLSELVERIRKCLTEAEISYEILLTDDRSPDGTWALATELAGQYPEIRPARLKKNSGQMAATLAGIHRSTGKWIITLDDDLQYPPEEIIRMHEAIQNSEADLIFGSPSERKHNLSHNLTARIVMFAFDYLLLPRYRDTNFYTTFRIMRRSLFFDEIGQVNKGRNLFFFWEIPPKKMRHILVEHHFRKVGRSNQTLRSLLRYYQPQLFLGLKKISHWLYLTSALIFIGLVLSSKFLDFHFPYFLLILAGAVSVFFLLLNRLGKQLLEKSRVIPYEYESRPPA